MTTTTLHRLAVPLTGGRVLHLALHADSDGNAGDLLIAAGWPAESLLRVLGSGVSLPASALPALRDALATLAADTT